MSGILAKVRFRHNGRKVEREWVVDTGSTYTWISRKLLKKMGVRPERTILLQPITGKPIQRSIGRITVEYEDRRAETVVVFSRPGDAEVLGRYALEGLQLIADPVSRRLRKARVFLAY